MCAGGAPPPALFCTKCEFAHPLLPTLSLPTALRCVRPCSGDEQNTLFIALADHQRVGKGTLYHGLRTPMVLQFPSRVPPGQTLPASTLVSSLDIVPTALDAAGLLHHPPHPCVHAIIGAPTNLGRPRCSGGHYLGPILCTESTGCFY